MSIIKTKGMQELIGKRISTKAMPNYNFFAHLIDFDGPLLSLFKGEKNVDALFMWVDSDSSRNRWCVIPVERNNLDDYLAEKITLRDLYSFNKTVTYFNYRDSIREEGRVLVKSSCVSVNVINIPDGYLPKDDSYLYDEISTPEAMSLKEEVCSNYNLGIDKELYFDDLSIIPKKFIELYSFHYALDHLNIPSVRERVQELTGKWDGGISVVNMFGGLKNIIPSIHRPTVKSLVYNSPGNIELNLISSLADEIKSSVDASMSSIRSGRMVKMYESTYRYFKVNNISGFDSENSANIINLTDDVKLNLDSRARIFIKLLKLNAYDKVMKWVGGNELQRMRTILAYYRRFKILSEYQREGKLLIGESLVNKNPPPRVIE